MGLGSMIIGTGSTVTQVLKNKQMTMILLASGVVVCLFLMFLCGAIGFLF
jgi:hypothetical protein